MLETASRVRKPMLAVTVSGQATAPSEFLTHH